MGKGGKGPGPGGGAGGGISGSTMGMLALFAGLVLILGGIAVADQFGLFGASTADDCDTLEGRSLHEHAELFVYLNSSEPFDFSPQRYQVQEGFVHFEGGRAQGPDTTVHIHEARPTLGCLFGTVGWQVSGDEIVTDQGDVYAEDANHQIEILVDGKPAEDGFRTLLVGQRNYEVRYTYTGDAGAGNQTDGNDTGNETGGNQTAASLGLIAPAVGVPAARRLRR